MNFKKYIQTNKSKELWTSIIIPFMLLIIFFATLPVFRNEQISTITILTIIIISLLIKHNHREWLLAVIGIILGLIFEIAGDAIFKVQYWQTDSIIGIPLWLPLLWGFTFIIIYRLGSVIVKK